MLGLSSVRLCTSALTNLSPYQPTAGIVERLLLVATRRLENDSCLLWKITAALTKKLTVAKAQNWRLDFLYVTSSI